MKKNCSGIIVIQDLYINLFNLFLALIYIYTYLPPLLPSMIFQKPQPPISKGEFALCIHLEVTRKSKLVSRRYKMGAFARNRLILGWDKKFFV